MRAGSNRALDPCHSLGFAGCLLCVVVQFFFFFFWLWCVSDLGFRCVGSEGVRALDCFMQDCQKSGNVLLPS